MKTSLISLRLSVDDPEARTILAAAAGRLIDGPANPRLSVTLEGEQLPAAIVAALVAVLRRLRDVGGALEVVPASPAVGDALRVHGLDRVFAFPLPPEEPASRAGRHGGLGRALRGGAAVAFAALALAGSARHAQAQGELPTDVPAILERVIERNPNLSSYQGRLHVDFRLVSFPYIRQHLDATTYFKRPASYEVVFDRVPSYARGFEKLYSDLGDPTNWQRRFVITYVGEQRFGERDDLELRLVQRVRGMIDHETVLVDPRTWAVDQIKYDYYNGGTITMTQRFREVGGFSLLVSQRAEIAVPYVRAVAVGSYDRYQTNVAIDDAVFRKGDGQ